MLGYRIDDQRGRLPIQFRDRGLWRDFDSLLPDESHLAPMVNEHATTLARSNRERFPRSVMVLGQANNKAKIEYWRMERFALPLALAGKHPVRTEIRQFTQRCRRSPEIALVILPLLRARPPEPRRARAGWQGYKPFRGTDAGEYLVLVHPRIPLSRNPARVHPRTRSR